MKKYKKINTIQENEILEINSGELITVPDQGHSVRDILQRFSNGNISDDGQELFYSEDMPDLSHLGPDEYDNYMKTVIDERLYHEEKYLHALEEYNKRQKEEPTPEPTPEPNPQE